MTAPGGSGWRELTVREVQALAPYTLWCAGLSRKARRQVERAWCEGVFRGYFELLQELDRDPNGREVAMLVRVVVARINEQVIPQLGGAGGAHVHATLQ